MTDAPLPPETVRWAYLLLLGREPESPAVLENWRHAGLAGLRAGILGSAEFMARAAAGRLGSPVEAAPDRAALRAALALRDGAWPGDAALEAAGTGHDVDTLRAAVLEAPDIAALLPRREGLRTRRLRIGAAEWPLLGDTRDPDFAGAPGPAPVLAAAVRALFPEGGAGLRIADHGAGIGLASLAMAAGAPGHESLEAWEERLPEAAFLAANLLALPRARVVATAPPAGGGQGLVRLQRADAALALPEGTAALLRLDLRRLLLEERGEPRAALAALAGRFAGAAALMGTQAPLPLDAAGQEATLAAALDGPVELVLAPDAAWMGRFGLG